MVPLGYRNMLDALSNMAQCLIMRFLEFVSVTDLICAIEIASTVVEQAPEGDSKLGGRLVNLSRVHTFNDNNYPGDQGRLIQRSETQSFRKSNTGDIIWQH